MPTRIEIMHTLAESRIQIRLLLLLGKIGLLRSLLHQRVDHAFVGNDGGGDQTTTKQEWDADRLGDFAGAYIGGNLSCGAGGRSGSGSGDLGRRRGKGRR